GADGRGVGRRRHVRRVALAPRAGPALRGTRRGARRGGDRTTTRTVRRRLHGLPPWGGDVRVAGSRGRGGGSPAPRRSLLSRSAARRPARRGRGRQRAMRYTAPVTVREILKMGDPRLLRIARPVEAFDTPELHALVHDMFATMEAAGGVGLAAPQIGVDLALVIFGFGHSERYPEAPAVPRTILLNPTIEPLADEEEEGWEGCLSVPGLRGLVPRWTRIRYRGFDLAGEPIDRVAEGF